MVTVYYSNSEGTSFGRDLASLSEALDFVEQDARANRRMLGANRATVVESDGVMMKRRFRFSDGDLVSLEVQRDGRMVSLMEGELSHA